MVLFHKSGHKCFVRSGSYCKSDYNVIVEYCIDRMYRSLLSFECGSHSQCLVHFIIFGIIIMYIADGHCCGISKACIYNKREIYDYTSLIVFIDNVSLCFLFYIGYSLGLKSGPTSFYSIYISITSLNSLFLP